jgi:hypothetical protein
VTRRALGVAEGASVLAALVAVPVALVGALRAPLAAAPSLAVEALVGIAVLAWASVVVALGRLVGRQLRGGTVEAGPMGWAAVRVAALLLLVAPFLEAHGHAPSRVPPRPVARRATVTALTVVEPRRPAARAPDPPAAPGTTPRRAAHANHGPRRCPRAATLPVDLGTAAVLVGLAADVRRRARLGRRVVVDDDHALDVETTLLASPTAPTGLLAGAACTLAAEGGLGRPRARGARRR